MNGIEHQLGENGVRNQVRGGIPTPCISFVFQFTFFSSFSDELLRMQENTHSGEHKRGDCPKLPGAQQVEQQLQFCSFSYKIQRLALKFVLIFVFLPSHFPVKLLVISVEKTQRTLTHYY